MAGFIIEWYEGCWFAPWDSDPGRTLVLKHAKVYASKSEAKMRLKLETRQCPHRDFSKARILPAPDGMEPDGGIDYCMWCGGKVEEPHYYRKTAYCSTECIDHVKD